MDHYRAYKWAAVGFLVVFAGFVGAVAYWSEPATVEAVVEPSAPVAEPGGRVAPAAEKLAGGANVDIQPLLSSENQLFLQGMVEEFLMRPEAGGGAAAPAGPVATAAAGPIVVVMPSGASADTSPASGGSTSGGAGSTSTAGNTASRTTSGGGGGTYKLPAELAKTRGIGSIFLPSNKLRHGSQRLPMATTMDNLLKYDIYWYAQLIANNHPEAWRTLRTQHPDRLALHYVTLFTVRPDAPSSYLDYDYIEKHRPEWFLLKDEKNASAEDYRNPNKRIRWNPNDPKDWNYNRFFLDVNNPDFQDWAISEFLKRLDPVSGVNARIRYSGIGGDNALFHSWAIQKTREYPNWKYSDSRGSRWTGAYISYIKRLHAALKNRGHVLIINHTIPYYTDEFKNDFGALIGAVDGLMKEWGVRYSTGLYGDPQWETILRYHEQTLRKDLYNWWLFDGFADYDKLPFTQYEHFMYEYCTYLLIQNPDLSFYGIHNKGGSADWFEEFDLPLGKPIGLRYKQQGCWMRDYQHAKVVVNPSDAYRTIILNSDTYTLDWRAKKKITQLTLEPRSATILMPTGYSVEKN